MADETEIPKESDKEAMPAEQNTAELQANGDSSGAQGQGGGGGSGGNKPPEVRCPADDAKLHLEVKKII